MLEDILSVVTSLAALLAPLFVYLVARARLQHDEGRGRAEDDNTLWERMTTLLNIYSRRADELDERMRAEELRSDDLARSLADLQTQLTRWRAYAVALANQLRGLDVTPVDPRLFGLGDEDMRDE